MLLCITILCITQLHPTQDNTIPSLLMYISSSDATIANKLVSETHSTVARQISHLERTLCKTFHVTATNLCDIFQFDGIHVARCRWRFIIETPSTFRTKKLICKCQRSFTLTASNRYTIDHVTQASCLFYENIVSSQKKCRNRNCTLISIRITARSTS